ncbi:MAG: HNH endonuclease [Actinobacteria bacterium]|nr:HNH endonuclease [Actinomycetota bacterium]
MPEVTAESLRSAAEQLLELADDVEESIGAREDLDAVIADLRIAAVRGFGPKPRARRGESGKDKVLAHLMAHIGEWVHREELAAISGIEEWARRKREWSREEGYDIEERGGFYRLNNFDPDESVARAWRIPNEIRRRSGSGESRILALLQAYEGKVVDNEKLRYVAHIPSAPRRTRELRDEDGWPIETHVDDPKLKPGQYRLASSDPSDRRDIRQRLYPEGLRERIFQRDEYTCQMCGRNRERAEQAGDSRFYLEIHHLNAVADQLDGLSADELNDESNLVTYCHRDHLQETRRLHERLREQRRPRS